MRTPIKLLQALFASTLLLASSLLYAQGQVVASGVNRAENAIQTSNQRLFVSSDGGFYELTVNGGVWSKTPVAATFASGKTAACYYLGVAETAGMLYTLCAENWGIPLSPNHLLGFSIYDTAPHLVEIGPLQGMVSPNGLAADSSGNLYAVDSGLLGLPGAIHKITLAGSNAIATQSVFYQYDLWKPNGLKISGGSLYVSLDPLTYAGLSKLVRYDLGSNGLSNQTAIYDSLWVLDDFTLVQGGVVIAEDLGYVTHVGENSRILHRQAFPILTVPTSVALLTAPPFGAGSLLVTEMGTGNAIRLANNWGLQAR